MKRIVILGGYGNFGGYVARALAPDPGITLIIAGRNLDKARVFATELGAANPVEATSLDIFGDLAGPLAALTPDMVIHTIGPFQTQDYRVAEAAIAAGAHYCDLADARAFVGGIGALDADARQAGDGAIDSVCIEDVIDLNHYLLTRVAHGGIAVHIAVEAHPLGSRRIVRGEVVWRCTENHRRARVAQATRKQAEATCGD